MEETVIDGAAPAVAEPSPPSASSEPSLSEVLSSKYDELSGAAEPRTRDERGKFVSAKPAEPAPADAQPEEAETDQGQTQETTPAAPEAPPVEPPKRWSQAERDEFAKLPPETQKIVLERETERDRAVNAKFQQIAAERQFYAQLNQPMQSVARFAQHFKAHPGQVIATWAAAQEGLLKDPKATLQSLAKQYGVDLSQPAADGEQPYVDPQVASLQETIRRLEGQLSQVTGHITARQREETAAKVQTLSQSISEFRDAKDDAGNLKHPHYEAVREDMALLIEGGRAKDLETAYGMAVYANPQTRAMVLAAERKAAEEKAAKERADAAKRAEKAGAVSPRAGNAPARPQPASLRDALESAWDNLSGR